MPSQDRLIITWREQFSNGHWNIRKLEYDAAEWTRWTQDGGLFTLYRKDTNDLERVVLAFPIENLVSLVREVA